MAASRAKTGGGRKKVAAKGAGSKKKAAAKKVPARKKVAAKKTAAKKATAKKAAARKATAKKTVAKKATAKEEAPAAPAASGVSSMSVNLGHIFALRPRVTTSFRPDNFRAAKQRLQDESYATIEEAARAVAEEALDLTRDTPKRGFRR